MDTVGTRVRHYRRARRLTQEELAEKAGVDRRYLGKIETGDVEEPGVETMKRLAEALGVAIRQIAEPLGWYADEPDQRAKVVVAGRGFTGLTDDDLEEVARFAEYLEGKNRS